MDKYYKEYPKDIWDYLDDMPYLPSRTDRDQLINGDDFRRVQIWDYFFRVKTEDVGLPQKKEIFSIDKYLAEEKKSILSKAKRN